MITASTLFAGERHKTGSQRCYYCGAPCDGTHKTRDYVKKTFTNRDIAKFPASEHVCEGCAMSLGDGWADMEMIDGSVKAFTTPRSMAPRLYSWLITAGRRLAFTKAHVPVVRGMLTDEERLPEPPFAWVLADSGQKQLIFRAPVARSKRGFPVLLEEEEIRVDPGPLRARLALAGYISRKIGKPALTGGAGIKTYIAAQKAGAARELDEWARLAHEPLSRLAAWLAPPKDK